MIPYLLARILTIHLFEWYILFESYVSNTIPQGHLLVRTLLLSLSNFFITVYLFFLNTPVNSALKHYKSEGLVVVS